jgi:SAM-dependent methyltransferase
MKLCKVYKFEDTDETDPLWLGLLNEMCPWYKEHGPIHRHYWEFAVGLYGLARLGCIWPDARALSVGAGVEWPLFYLANRIDRVDAIDIYDDTWYGGEKDPTVPGNAEKLAPFPYRGEALIFQRMNALDLEFADDSFDFVFSFSSIEHFNAPGFKTHEASSWAMQEIARVLKPGGVAAISTELLLDDVAHPEYFSQQEIDTYLVKPSGLELVEPVDYGVDERLRSDPIWIDGPPGTSKPGVPHTSIRLGGVTITSVVLFLRKPAGWRSPRRLMMRSRVRSRLAESLPAPVRGALRRLIPRKQ